MIVIEGKVLCIKTYYIGDNIENIQGKIYEYYIDEEGYWVVSEDEYSSTLINNFENYFITLAEWRDKRINEILEDD